MSANKAFLLLLVSSVIILIGLTGMFIKTVPLLFSHAVYVCQKAFSNVLFALSHSLPLLLITVTVAILLIGTLALTVQILRTRKYLKERLNRRISMPSIVRVITQELNLHDRIDIVEDSNTFSFCYGLLRPRICLSTGLLRTLTEDEVKAVLLHESYHIRNHDPLKIILGKTASVMFFFIPILAEIQNYYAFSKEIAADEVVMRGGNRKALISVLSKLFVSRPYSLGLAALANGKDLERRIAHLTGRKGELGFRPSIFNIVFSIIVMLFSFVTITTPLYAISTDSNSTNQPLFICPFNEYPIYTPAIFMSTQK